MVYQDFDLLIDRTASGYRAQVLNSPAGQASAEFCLPFSDDKLENFLLRLGRTRRAVRRVDTPEMHTAKTFGASLFNAVFSGDIKACFRSSLDEAKREGAGLRIRLRLADPEAVDLPWEFLYNPTVNRFLALSVQTPLVRYMDLPERIQPVSITPPIRALVMISSPTDYPALDVEAEWTRLNDSLKGLLASGHVAIDRLDDASLGALQRRLRKSQYHIFHFIGHGEFDRDAQEGVLILEGDNERGHRVSSQYLGMLLHDHESLRLAILNACEGARTAKMDPFAGSAQSLVQQGIPAVIAMQFEISDEVASTFAHEFYGAIADGYPIDAALTEARKAIFATGREIEWGTPVLYLRSPDGRIFDLERTSPARTADPARGLGRVDTTGRVQVDPDQQERVVFEAVMQARAAFAAGDRTEALALLRRLGPSHALVGEVLEELTHEHDRLTTLERAREKDRRDAVHAHVAAATELFSAGELAPAWERICEALQLDPGDSAALAIESRVRRALDEEVARKEARDIERRMREEEERARELARQAAIATARSEIEGHLTAGALEVAQKVLAEADASLRPGGALDEVRARMAELGRAAKASHDKAAGEAIEQARQEFTRDPAAAIALLQQFSPPHGRVTAVCRELKHLVAEQQARARREARQREQEARERQLAAEQRERELDQAIDRIERYLGRDELREAASALAAAESAFGSTPALQELRGRLGSAEQRVALDAAARAAVSKARRQASAGDYGPAIAALERFTPSHRDIDAALDALRSERELAERLRDIERRIEEVIARTAHESSHSVALASLHEALVLDPGHATLRAAIRERKAALRRERTSAAARWLIGSAGPRVAAVLVLITLSVWFGMRIFQSRGTLPTSTAPEPHQPVSERAESTASAPTSPVSQGAPAGSDARTPESSPAKPKGDGPAAPTHPVPVEGGATGRASKSGSPTGQEPRVSAPEDPAKTAGIRAPQTPGHAPATVDKPIAPDPLAASRPAEGAEAGTAKSVDPVAPPPRGSSLASSKPVDPAAPRLVPRATVEEALQAYEAAMTEGNLAALLAVYPGAPRELTEGLGAPLKGTKSYSMAVHGSKIQYDSGKTRARVDCTIFHNYISYSGKADTKRENRRLLLERRDGSWVLVGDNRR